jgi:NAD(P)-dependent dehydrogenase (short-subunit alcohol dehydrogenase family)
MFGISGTYVVVGGGSGVGAAIAGRLAQAGGDVVIAGRTLEKLREVAARIGASARRVDVADARQIDELVESAAPIRGLINCAAIGGFGPIVTTSCDQWREVMSVDLDGAFHCIRAAGRSMIASNVPGSILTVASVASQFAHRGLAAYCAAKAGIEMLTKVAALEFGASGIRVNALSPGLVKTGMAESVLSSPDLSAAFVRTIPLGRLAEPEDIADVAMLLCRSESRWITGQAIVADGGATLRIEPHFTPDELWTPQALRKAMLDIEPSAHEPPGLMEASYEID